VKIVAMCDVSKKNVGWPGPRLIAPQRLARAAAGGNDGSSDFAHSGIDYYRAAPPNTFIHSQFG